MSQHEQELSDPAKSKLRGEALGLRVIGIALEALGWLALAGALILALVALNSMSDSVSTDETYTTSQRIMTFAVVGLSTGIPSLLLVGFGRAMRVFGTFVAAGAGATFEPVVEATAPTKSDGTI